MLKEKLGCTEDMRKRRIATDMSNRKSEVEAQHSIQFEHDDIQHSVHLTFYYTKCSLWLQGNSTKINNLTIAQFFTYYYIERIASCIEKSVPLDKIGKVMADRIRSFLSADEQTQLNGEPAPQQDDRCVTCPRRCMDNDKSMACLTCKRKQHFNCANIRDDNERQLFLTYKEDFRCSKCIHINTPEVIHEESERNLEEVTIPVETTINETEDRRPPLQIEGPRESGNSMEPSSNSDHSDQSKEIMIRRLKEEVKRIQEESNTREQKFNDQIESLKEAYRLCVTKLEKEKDTRETLEKCLNAFRQKEHEENQSSSAQTDPEEEEDHQRVNNRLCRFFNRRNGCRKNSECAFQHRKMPQCRNINNCRRLNCPFDHKRVDTQHNNDGHTKRDRICRFFNRRHGCRKQGTCSYSHVTMPPCPNMQYCLRRDCKYDHKPQVAFLDQSNSIRPPDPNNTQTTNRQNQMQELENDIQAQIEREVRRNLQSYQLREVTGRTYIPREQNQPQSYQQGTTRGESSGEHSQQDTNQGGQLSSTTNPSWAQRAQALQPQQQQQQQQQNPQQLFPQQRQQISQQQQQQIQHQQPQQLQLQQQIPLQPPPQQQQQPTEIPQQSLRLQQVQQEQEQRLPQQWHPIQQIQPQLRQQQQTHQAMQQTQLTQRIAPTVNMIPAQPIQYLNPISMSQQTPIYNQIPYLYTQIPA